jgi:putative DNA methylase
MEWPGTSGLAADVRYYGRWIRDEAEKRIAHLYPKVKVTAKMAKDRKDLEPYAGQELTVLAWLWARTVTCPNPACRTKLPLLKAYSLCTKPSRTRRLVPRVNQERGSITFDVEAGKTDGREGTISRSGATCLACSTHIPYAYIREAGRAGQMSEQLLAVVCDGPRGRLYFSPDRLQEDAAATARPKWCPQIDIPHNPFSLRPPLYGFAQFSDLFTNRQLVAMEAFSSLIQRLKAALPASIDPAYRDALLTYSAMNVSRLANRCSSACFWDPGGEKIQQVFARQAIAMAWDFVEANPLGSASGSFLNQIDYLAAVIEQSPPCSSTGQVLQRDACDLGQWGKGILVSTDPPYYDNIDYADLSDFFYVWLRRMLEGVYPENFGTMLTPKTRELVATPYRFNGDREAAEAHFREGLANVLTAICRQNVDGIPASIIYAFKQQEEDDSDGGRASTGWETFLQSAVDVGFSVTGTWPLRTELAGNLKNQMNALASSIVLACRRRDAKAKVATRKEFLVSLRRELSPAMRNLQHGSIAPVDLAQAAIGPGMAVFTRYAKVMEGDGSPMTVRTALGLINQTLDEVLAEQEGEFDTDTRWALAWFEQHGMDEGPFGVAETLSKAKNTSVTGMVEAGVVAARGGKVKLLGRDDLPADWDPATDERLTVWEVTQYLIRALEQHGERGAAELLKKVGGMGEVARDLAYRLYVICERKKWAQEALAYNSLVVAWPEITKLAQGAPPAMPRKEQGELGL